MTGSGAEAGATVTLYDTNGTTVLGTAVAGASGNWTITSSPLSSGVHSLTVKQTDVAGNTSMASAALPITVDTVAAAPTITTVTDDFGSVQGTVSNNGSTDDSTPTLTITAEAGSTVTVYQNGQPVGTATEVHARHLHLHPDDGADPWHLQLHRDGNGRGRQYQHPFNQLHDHGSKHADDRGQRSVGSQGRNFDI